MAKKKADKKVKDEKKDRQRQGPSRVLLMSLGVNLSFLRKNIPKKGPHKLRIVT